MGLAAIRKKANALLADVNSLCSIANEADHENALALMDELIGDYTTNRPLIILLADAIERWEAQSDAFDEFNAAVASLGGVDALKLLMEQHGLGVADLPEIGCKSLVSKILNGRGRNLTRNHIAALSKRFDVSPEIFF
jgi:HTH-type transcriptional regulator / antitoxin HigA